MEQRSKKLRAAQEVEASPLGELIHEAVRAAIEVAVQEELVAALGAAPYERAEVRHGYRNGSRSRLLTGPTGPVGIEVPRATLFTAGGETEWASKILPRYQRRLPEMNEALAGAYLAGANMRRIRGALRPLLRTAPLSKSAVSRVVVTLKSAFAAWRARPLGDLDVAFVYLDAFVLKARSGGKVTSLPVLGAVAVLADGRKQLLSLEMCGSESFDAWKGFVDDLVVRGLRVPRLAVIDGNLGLRRAVELTWPQAEVQRCVVHKLRNILRKVGAHVREEIRENYGRIVYAESEAAAKEAWTDFERK